jgi:hypothetical protein
MPYFYALCPGSWHIGPGRTVGRIRALPGRRAPDTGPGALAGRKWAGPLLGDCNAITAIGNVVGEHVW